MGPGDVAGGHADSGSIVVRGFPVESPTAGGPSSTTTSGDGRVVAGCRSGSVDALGLRGALSLRRVESRFRGHRNVSLFRRTWHPESPRRAIVVVHGFGEHSGRYETFAAWFANAGASVFSFDLRGHGRSGGPRGHVESMADFLNDLERFLEVVRDETDGLPISLVGHSMGGLIVAAFAVKRDPRVICIATSGALLASPALSPAKALLARLVRSVMPRLAFEAGIDPRAISTIPEEVERYREDPLVHGRSSVSLVVELLEAARSVAGAGQRVERPMLLMHGALDTLCLPEGSDAFYRSLPATERDVPVADLRIYSRSRHEIFNDVEREIVFADLLGWIERCEANAGVADEQ